MTRRRRRRIMGFVARGTRPEEPPPNYAWDGIISQDYRKVRKGGHVLFFADTWQHDSLIEFIGKWVWVSIGEYWGGSIDVYGVPYEPKTLICMIKSN